ncbi:MAG: type I secretion system permease/ATPase [Sphingobium sp.]|uniref:type I secretion system permease/ATPase n=1 Tax=Sphingobium sp. TaxID=1912891 RepID=UPI0029B49325|nr:type I secretion system permease/ATPase [Sphingobium sp.]MDX3908284.1 type I secretion system permease/ATPase [Sphingobium sp.]
MSELAPSSESPRAAPASDLMEAVRRYRKAWITVGFLSAVLSVLQLSGALYMMMVYDSVLPSRSIPTLIGLLLMLVVMYVFQGMFDTMRTRILGDIASALDCEWSPRVQRAISDAALRGHAVPGDGLTPMRDLENIRSFMSGTGPGTIMDLPWIVFFLGILFLLHVWLGVTALVGAVLLLGLTLLTDRAIKAPAARLSQVAAYRNSMAETNLRHAELLTVLGMRGRMEERWQNVNRMFLSAQSSLARSTGVLGGFSKLGRMFLQSAILTVGALLVIDGKASGGVIFASSILSGRALAPIDQAIANWRAFAAAKIGWRRLSSLLHDIPPEPERDILLPPPAMRLEVQNLFVAPPGTQRLTVQGVEFTLEAGSALAVIGASAAGKSSLARGLVGAWRPVRGSVRLDGATLDQWPSDVLGRSIGYMPQMVELFDGTIADNISRFMPGQNSDAVIAAAQAAGVHEMIVAMPLGYQTPVGHEGAALSAGQRQRIGLARALYGDPFFVLLDEPNSNLDGAGERALSAAIMSVRVRKGIVIVIAHRPSALAAVDLVMVMREGRVDGFGPRDEILEKFLKLPSPAQPGGATASSGPSAQQQAA